MATPVWIVTLIKKTFPLVTTVARLTRNKTVGKIAEKILFEGDDIMILPKTRSITVDQKIDPIEHQVLPGQVVEHFIRKTEFHWIMNDCICREGANCQSFPHDLGCLFLGEAAMDINPALGRRVSQQEALDHVQRCRDAGLVHLVGRNKLDAVWLNVRPGHKLLTVCSCCSCCCLWRILNHVNESIAEKVTKMPGVEVVVNEAACQGCGECTNERENVCFVNAIERVRGKATINAQCRGCGRCLEVCPHDAIELRVDFDEAVERSIRRVDDVVDI